MIAWVTGGGTGIGLALAEALYREGYRVAISGRRKTVLEESASRISSLKGTGQIVALAADASQVQEVARVHANIQEIWGPVDLLINNAGVNPYHKLDDAPPEEFTQAFLLNCLTAIACTQAVLPGMLERGRGAIVNISSILGRWASANSAAYSVGKYALAGFTDVLHQRFAGSGIHVLGVYPGFILTDMTAPFVEREPFKRRFDKSPADIARAILVALRRKKRTLYYPWYVPWLLRFYHFMPATADRLARRLRSAR